MAGKETTERYEAERGQTLVEYALIIALISLSAIAALGFMSGKIQAVFSKSGNSLAAVCVSNPDGSCDGGTGGPGSPPPPPPPPPPTSPPGSVSIVCSGGIPGTCDDGDTLTANTIGWNNGPFTSFRFVWGHNTSFQLSGDCVDDSFGGTAWTPVETDIGAATTQTYAAPQQEPGPFSGGGLGDSIRVQVYATNAGGESTSFARACVVVQNL